MDLAKEVTTKETYQWKQGLWTLEGGLPEAKDDKDLPYHVVAYDFGAKRNILRILVDRGCRLTVVPAQTSAEEVLALNPDGIFLSNGPGDPELVPMQLKRPRRSCKEKTYFWYLSRSPDSALPLALNSENEVWSSWR